MSESESMWCQKSKKENGNSEKLKRNSEGGGKRIQPKFPAASTALRVSIATNN